MEELHMKLSNNKPLPQQMASPITFVHADVSSFRELVQKLTGANDQCQEKLPITPRYNSSSDCKQSTSTKLATKIPNESVCSKKIRSCTTRNSRTNRRIAAPEKKDGTDPKLEIKHESNTFKKSGISSVIRLPTLSDLVHSLVNSAAPASGLFENGHYSTESSSGASLELASICGEEASGCTIEDYCSSLQPATFGRTDGELKLLLLFPLHSEREDQMDKTRIVSVSAA